MITIALQMLAHDRARFIGIVVGVAFAALLITQQMAIFLGLLGRAGSAVGDVPQAQIWVMDGTLDAIDLDGVRPLPATAVQRVRSVPGVAWAVEHLRIPANVTLDGGIRRSALLVGIDADTWVGGPPQLVQGSWEDLRRADAVIVSEDALDKLATTGSDGRPRPLRVGDEIGIEDHRAVVVGVVRSTLSIYFSPSVFTTSDRLRSWLPATRRDVSFVLAGVTAGAAIDAVGARIEQATGFRARTGPGFIASSADYFAANTGIPINFGMAVGLGFLVGVAVAGLLFVQFVHENLRYLGALKAMGASNRTLVAMTVVQALTVGGLGLGLGTGLGALVGRLAGGGTGVLAWHHPLWLLGATSAAVLIIVLVAAVLGTRRVLALEPAAVFRS